MGPWMRTSGGGNAYRHYMLTASDGSSQQVYCVESGIAYNTSEDTYTSESGTNSNYLNLLPAEARRGHYPDGDLWLETGRVPSCFRH